MPSWLLAEVGAIAPIKPLTPEQARKRAAKQAKVLAQVKDEAHRHADKDRELQDRMA